MRLFRDEKHGATVHAGRHRCLASLRIMFRYRLAIESHDLRFGRILSVLAFPDPKPTRSAPLALVLTQVRAILRTKGEHLAACLRVCPARKDLLKTEVGRKKHKHPVIFHVRIVASKEVVGHKVLSAIAIEIDNESFPAGIIVRIGAPSQVLPEGRQLSAPRRWQVDGSPGLDLVFCGQLRRVRFPCVYAARQEHEG
jgi:hypothetical protein